MSARKFVGATSREVLYKVRRALGEDALIIANHTVAEGVEVLAVAASALGSATSEMAPADAAAVSKREPPSRPVPVVAEEDRPAALEKAGNLAVDGILSEIQRMRGLLQGELAALAISDQQRRNPAATGILGELLCAGFSPVTARAVTSNLPAGEPVEMLRRRVSTALERRLTTADSDGMIEGGGVFALVGPTGVGKTTTVAKLAARGVMRYGASGVALLTTDSYRIAAQDQLRVYGKILGVPVHPVKDAADLGALLSELGDKRLVLIDTVGMSQRDRMVSGQAALLAASPNVRRILMLNATSTVCRKTFTCPTAPIFCTERYAARQTIRHWRRARRSCR
jgi:flagellar biosynthesis protein FlhF